MAEPTDAALYNKSKQEVDKNYDKPSAYRSMAYTRTYLKNYREKYGDDKKAYKGKNPEQLKTWRREKWIDVKSALKDPKNPTACGNAPIKPGEYPLCMPIKEIAQYSKGELQLLVNRKNELGKKRLVKDAYLRDVLEPEKIPAIREYKEKYAKTKTEKLPEPLPPTEAKKILAEKPIKIEAPKPEKVPKPEKTEAQIQSERDTRNEKQKIRYAAKERIPKPRPRKSEEEKKKTLNARLDRKNAAAIEKYRKLRDEKKAEAPAVETKPPETKDTTTSVPKTRRLKTPLFTSNEFQTGEVFFN
jgi:hypothetical protein